MRNLRRPRLTPPTLDEGGAGFRAAQRDRKRRDVDAEAGLRFDSRHWNEADVRGALYAMHGPVCAYCQSSLERSVGDVDHFRPKSAYWWLAYSFENYFLTCSTCNQNLKHSRFPIVEGSARTTFADRKTIDQERRLLLDPCADDVEDWVETDYLDENVPLRNRVDEEKNPAAWLRVEETVRLLQLNTDYRLWGRRFEAIESASVLLDVLDENPRSAEKLRQMASRFAPHGVSVRPLLQRYRPDLLPTAEEEFRWLVKSFVAAFKRVRRIPAAESSPRVQRDAEMLRWALAVLWRDPPGESWSADVEDSLRKEGLLEDVRPLYEQLGSS